MARRSDVGERTAELRILVNRGQFETAHEAREFLCSWMTNIHPPALLAGGRMIGIHTELTASGV